MSIIIRLQHLPWSANAADIRQFFQNLTIPDGGVHIVGGENGDAFIAFGSDEDARQAMLLDGGKIKDVKIKLLLSSRAEMQKVIELAKQQAITLQNLMQSMAAASTFSASSLSMIPNMLTGISGLPSMSNLPTNTSANIVSLASVIPAPPTGQEIKAAQMNSKLDNLTSVTHNHESLKLQNERTNDNKASKSRSSSISRSRSHSQSRSRSRSRDRRHRDKHRYRDRSRDRKWHRDRSRSDDRSRSKDRYKRRSKSRERRSRDRSEDKDYKAKDRRRQFDKSDEKTFDRDCKSSMRKNQNSRNQYNSTVPPKSGNKEITTSNGLPQSDILNSESKPGFKMFFKPKPTSTSTVISNKTIPKEFQSQENEMENESTDTELMKTDEESSKWTDSVPMPPIISSWMLSQTAEKSVTDENGKKSPKSMNAMEQKADGSTPNLLLGMFHPGFPFGPGFPPPPAMYPFGAYNTTASSNSQTNLPAMPSLPVPPFFNPYQTATSLQSANTQINKMTDSSKDDVKMIEKLPRKDSKDEIRNEAGDYRENNYEQKKYSRMNNYYSDSSETRHHSSSNYRTEDYMSRKEFTNYDKSYGSTDDESRHKPYFRKNFNDSYDNSFTKERFERRDGYEYNDSRRYTSFTPSYPGSLCVEMINLPQSVAVIDIKKFFSPLPLYESSIKFQSDGKDDQTRNAFVKFLSYNHKLQALKYNDKFLKSNRITVLDMDSAKWEAAEDYTISTIDQPCLKISFIPKRAKRSDVLKEFSKTPDDMILMKDKNKDSLVAYLKFGNNEIVKNLLADRHNTLVCNRRVKFEPISEADYLVARADYEISDDGVDDEIDSDTSKQESVSSVSEFANSRWNNDNSEFNNENSRDRRSEVEEYEPQCKVIKSNCILLENLPIPVTDNEIVEFFSDIKVTPSEVHILFDSERNQTGDSYCEFSNEDEAAQALSKNNMLMKDNTVSVTLVPKEEVLRGFDSSHPEKQYPNMRSYVPSVHKRPYVSRPRAPFGSMPPRHPPPRGPVAPFRRAPGPELFGKPGCVVALENVPYKADVDEILEFFKHFDVQRENIIRRFNENGLATGDARVCLKSPVEAQKAVEHLDGKRIRDRIIYVSLVR